MVSLVAGCHGIAPMPPRLPVEAQENYEIAWEHFISQIDSTDRDEILDVMIMAAPWYMGVDRISFRAEKVVGEYVVVMETLFDRNAPVSKDAFALSVFDADNKLVRGESFSRFEIETAQNHCKGVRLGESEDEEEERRRMEECRAAFDARIDRVRELFPSEREEEPDEQADADQVDAPTGQ
jgi:hypothetical protein